MVLNHNRDFNQEKDMIKYVIIAMMMMMITANVHAGENVKNAIHSEINTLCIKTSDINTILFGANGEVSTGLLSAVSMFNSNFIGNATIELSLYKNNTATTLDARSGKNSYACGSDGSGYVVKVFLWLNSTTAKYAGKFAQTFHMDFCNNMLRLFGGPASDKKFNGTYYDLKGKSETNSWDIPRILNVSCQAGTPATFKLDIK